jgi:hypothetical protein
VNGIRPYALKNLDCKAITMAKAKSPVFFLRNRLFIEISIQKFSIFLENGNIRYVPWEIDIVGVDSFQLLIHYTRMYLLNFTKWTTFAVTVNIPISEICQTLVYVLGFEVFLFEIFKSQI